MAAVALRNGIIRARVTIAKTFASALTIASGGSAGREGPVIQFGSLDPARRRLGQATCPRHIRQHQNRARRVIPLHAVGKGDHV